MNGEPPDSIRGAVFGRSGSGKTYYVRERWFPHFPRLIILDQTGEWRSLERENGGRADGLGQLVAAMQAKAGLRRWRIVADLDAEEVEEFATIIIPRGAVDRSPSRLLGGMALFIDEVDLVAPINATPGIRSIFRRGRHAGLSVISASQRPANVSKEVTSQAQFLAILALHEKNDVAYLRQVLGAETAGEALAWANSAPWRVAIYSPRTGALTLQEGK